MDTFATFNSRSDAIRLQSALNQRGLVATIINTPRIQGLSCGLSVLFDGRYRNAVLNVIDELRLKSFYGIHLR